MKLFIVGVGYTAGRLIATHAPAFSRISGTVRSAEKRAQFAALDIDLFDGNTASPDTLAKAASANVVLISAPPSPTGDAVLEHFATAIVEGAAQHVIYLSTVGVYGDHGGDWIDEDTVPAPELDRTASRLAVEQRWHELLGDRLAVLRLAGIYGPGRNALVELSRGRARRIVKPGQVFNRIHTDDIARAIMAAIVCEHGGIWNICDDEPAPPQDVIAFAAGLLGLPPPLEEPFETAEMTPMARSFYADNKRVSIAKLKKQLGFALKYPTYREGLSALAEAGEGGAGASL
jgi:nucleoside-diphosphate-sugar epimerase